VSSVAVTPGSTLDLANNEQTRLFPRKQGVDFFIRRPTDGASREEGGR
jgi:hypothetical protein